MEEQFTSRAIIHHQIKFLCGLKSKPQFNNKRIINQFQNPPLSFNMLHLVPFYHLLLLQNFHGIDLLVVIFLHKKNLAITALAHDFNGRKVINAKFIICDALDALIIFNLIKFLIRKEK